MQTLYGMINDFMDKKNKVIMKKILLPLVTVALIAACFNSENEMKVVAPQAGADSSCLEASAAPSW